MLLSTSATASTRSVLASLRIEPVGSAAALCGALPVLAPVPPRAGAGALSVTIDDGYTRSFVVRPPSGARGLRELRASAAARFATLYGESAESWLLAADWQAARPFVASAVPRELYAAFEHLARILGCRLDSVSPALIRVWNHVCASIPSDGWLVVGFGQTLTLLHTAVGEVASLRSLRLSHTPEQAELETLLEQERLRTPADAATRARQSLLWAGAADWLPATTTMVGLASCTIRLPAAPTPAGDLPRAQQLALAADRQ
mgnify:CR=1 FL=1